MAQRQHNLDNGVTAALSRCHTWQDHRLLQY